MKRSILSQILALLITTILIQQSGAQVLTSPETVYLTSPLIISHNISSGGFKMISLEASISQGYANLSIYWGDQLIVDNIDIPNSGDHSLTALTFFYTKGNSEIKCYANGQDITLKKLDIIDFSGNLSMLSFTDVTDASGIYDEPSLKYGGPSVADIDNDGDYDLILNNHNDSPSKLFWNNGDGTFTKNTHDLSLWNRMDLHGSALGDYDNDGDMDILIALGGGNGTSPQPPVFFKNNNSVFVRSDEKVGMTSGARGRAGRWSDMDLDGDLDLMLINAAGINDSGGSQHIFYKNKGDGTFETINIAGIENQMAERVILSDFNGDHIDDAILFSPISLWQGNGDFTFTNVTNQWITGETINDVQAVCDIDYDNDGDLDFYLARGQAYFEVAEYNTVDFFPTKEHADFRTSGSAGIQAFEVASEGAIVISGFDKVRRSTYDGDFPFFLGSAKHLNILEVNTGILTITPEMAEGWPEKRTENGMYVGYVGNGVWKLESVRNNDLFWSIHYSLNGIRSFTADGWTPINKNEDDIFLRNDGSFFTNVTDEVNIPKGGNHWGVTRGDFNNDSYEDLFVYRFGYLKNRVSDWLLLNDGNGRFLATTAHNAGNPGDDNHGDSGQAFDYDLDGDIDILSGDDEYGEWHLYANESINGFNFIKVNVGYAPKSNIDPIGAEVIVITPKQTFKKRVGSAGEVFSQSVLSIVHFGLGDITKVDTIYVRYRNGETIIIKDPELNTINNPDSTIK